MAIVEYWFGTYGDRPLLYDPSFQVVGYPYVFLWNIQSGQMQTFPRERARALMSTDMENVDRSVSIRRYEEWRFAEGATYLEAAKKEYGPLREAMAAQAKRAAVEAALVAAAEIGRASSRERV